MADINNHTYEFVDGSKEYEKHTQKYTELLQNYIAHTKSSNEIKNTYKKIFFWVIMTIMVALAVLFIITISSALHIIEKLSGAGSIESIVGVITTVVSSFVTMLVSLFKLPQIIAEYLFNPEEDKNMATIIGDIQKYNIGMYTIEKDIEKNAMQKSEEDSVIETEEYIENPNDAVDELNGA